jgi:hypothetical protein
MLLGISETLGEFRGKQELFTRQSPQKLKVLREHALIESAVFSNRIEGVSVEPSRLETVLIATKPLFRSFWNPAPSIWEFSSVQLGMKRVGPEPMLTQYR